MEEEKAPPPQRSEGESSTSPKVGGWVVHDENRQMCFETKKRLTTRAPSGGNKLTQHVPHLAIVWTSHNQNNNCSSSGYHMKPHAGFLMRLQASFLKRSQAWVTYTVTGGAMSGKRSIGNFRRHSRAHCENCVPSITHVGRLACAPSGALTVRATVVLTRQMRREEKFQKGKREEQQKGTTTPNAPAPYSF